MPPLDNNPQSVIRYLTRLLSVIADRNKGEVRIAKSALEQLAGENPARALFEDFDTKTDEVVLRFRPKSLATYLIEETTCTVAQPNSIPTQDNQKSSTKINSPSHTQGRLPLTDDQIVKMETVLAKEKRLRAIRQSRQEAESILPGL